VHGHGARHGHHVQEAWGLVRGHAQDVVDASAEEVRRTGDFGSDAEPATVGFPRQLRAADAQDVVRAVDHDIAFMTWNLMHLAALLKRASGVPAHGNQRSEWDAGRRLDAPNPDYR
jgi:hypothetical protein